TIGAGLAGRVLSVLRPWRRRLEWSVLGMALASGCVTLLKLRSPHHCPWDLAEYGGYAPHLALFEALPAGIAPGHCFPAGHASGGFALLAFHFALRDRHPRWARIAAIGALVLGWIMGWAQTMRGAHFVSHTLWSAWWSWMVLLLLYTCRAPLAD
ncbi:MAG TPA: phosphatase PAP2 family protein, partial [Chitinolyticbacter sp.]|nr:phosphatase PAP2 family protein [Chitinolyticbacter sp.]